MGIVIPIKGIFTSLLKLDEDIILILNGILIGILLAVVDWIRGEIPKIPILTGVTMIIVGILLFIGSIYLLRLYPVSSW